MFYVCKLYYLKLYLQTFTIHKMESIDTISCTTNEKLLFPNTHPSTVNIGPNNNTRGHFLKNASSPIQFCCRVLCTCIVQVARQHCTERTLLRAQATVSGGFLQQPQDACYRLQHVFLQCQMFHFSYSS